MLFEFYLFVALLFRRVILFLSRKLIMILFVLKKPNILSLDVSYICKNSAYCFL